MNRKAMDTSVSLRRNEALRRLEIRGMYAVNTLSYLMLAFPILILVPPCKAGVLADLSTSEGFVGAVANFSQSGTDTEVRLQKNITFHGSSANGWPIKNLTRGTLRIVPHPDLVSTNIPLFLDGGMLTMPMTEPFTGAMVEVSI